MPVQLMNQKCAICAHPDTAKLNVALINGTTTLRAIEKSFPGVSRSSLGRHKRTCLPTIASAALQSLAGVDADVVPEPETVDGRAKEMASKGRSAVLLALKRRDYRTAFAGMREIRGFLEIMGKISGELGPSYDSNPRVPMFQLPPGTTVSVTINQNRGNDSGSADKTSDVIELVAEEASL